MNRLLLMAMVALGAIFGVAGSWVAERFAPDPARGRTEAVVRDYLRAHPEVIPEAIDRAHANDTARQRTEAVKQIAANRSAILKPYGNAWAGNPDGDVTLVEYFDYNCGYCRASLPTIEKLLASDPKLKIVFRELPILTDESGTSYSAAKLSLAAADQGKFTAFHKALYSRPVTPDSMVAAAQSVGLDPAQAKANAASATAEIKTNLEMAQKLGMTGTPSWVIGDQVISSALPLETLQTAIAEIRTKR